MSEAPRARPVPVGRLVTSAFRPRPPGSSAGRPVAPVRNAWPVTLLGAAALCPLLITTAAVLLLALRPVPQGVTETAYASPAATPDDDDPWPDAAEEAGPAIRVEPGEARPLSTDGPPAAAPEPVAAEPVPPAACQRFGTAVDFVRSPAVAFARAAREQKLVMVLHLAGNFDDPGFT